MPGKKTSNSSVESEESAKKTASKTQSKDKMECPELPETEEEVASETAAYSMRPAFGESFPSPIVKSIINSVMTEKLKDKTYDKDVANNWTSEIADDVNQQIAANPKVKRYKHVVQVMLGQELGAGSTYLSRCCWDCDCDTSVTDTFSNTSLFCVCTVFATYQY